MAVVVVGGHTAALPRPRAGHPAGTGGASGGYSTGTGVPPPGQFGSPLYGPS